MKEFFKKLLSGESPDVSSRRFISFVSMGLIIIVVILSFFGVEIPINIFNGLISITLITLGLTTLKPL